MESVCENNKCNGCMACVDICPKNCVYIEDKLFSYNALKNIDMCINCGACESVCPNNSPIEYKESIEWYQGWADEEIRLTSSSGGAASAIARSFILSGGYVASCIFRYGEFIFEITNDLIEAKKFAGSKYVKSNPEGIYKRIREKLKTNKVLFIGLPCQVAGLKNYVSDQENLYTIDLICHGTPSPKVLKQYLREFGYEIDNLENIKFRDKNSYGLRDKNIKVLEKGRDSYLISFLNGICYTENCYTCKFARKERVADVTLGDSWGTEYKGEAINGISLLLVQTDKGRELVDNSKIKLLDVDYETAVRANHQLNHPPSIRSERNSFLKVVSEGGSIKVAVKQLLPKEVVKQKLKYYLAKYGLLKKHGRFINH